MANNKVTFGLEKVHIAFVDETSPTQPAWKAPIPIPGAVRWTPTTVGEASTFYADNTAYFVATSNNGYTAELEMALVPDAVLAEMLGWQIDANGMLVEVSDGIAKKFALMGQVQGDQKNRRFVYFNCQASRPAKERTTKNETITPSTDVLSIVVSPMEIGGRTIVKGDIELSDTNAAAYNAFFSAVTVPTFGAASKTALAANIAFANSLTQANYTPATWTKLTAAKTAATTVNSNGSAAQAQVDSANTALSTAILGLVVV
ncbi:phage major tail protein, phi13 family [Paenibacillus sp. UNCCL117]|uniref:major tail protein n=1 Tax=unclassified Paenibacillus TaxID=185978 RepID=UPI00088A45B9|nr:MULTISPECIES: major tail protein [unclassified Paenibacillus]SDC69976.1 phage major tail protein, phi13 family [Paenibacillus sp. cl123]SFW24080.1 phage major tail protein, phi13 family [Paenibacillus sp. UNCCL117]